MIPPVEVPAMRSKYRCIGSGRQSSSTARKDAGNMPFIPPPSIERMRNLAIAVLFRGRFVSAALPLSRDQPCLVEKQPQCCPLNDSGRDYCVRGHPLFVEMEAEFFAAEGVRDT